MDLPNRTRIFARVSDGVVLEKGGGSPCPFHVFDRAPNRTVSIDGYLHLRNRNRRDSTRIRLEGKKDPFPRQPGTGFGCGSTGDPSKKVIECRCERGGTACKRGSMRTDRYLFEDEAMRLPMHVASTCSTRPSIASSSETWNACFGTGSGIPRLNAFLRVSRERIQSKERVTLVVGNESADLDSVVSSLMLAYFKEETDQDKSYIPLISIPRADMKLRSDVSWLLDDLRVETESLLFADEVDLQDMQMKNRLEIFLVDHNKVPKHLDFLIPSVVGVVDHHRDEGDFANLEERYVQPVGSCASLVVQMIAKEKPDILAASDLCRLLLSVILMDTVCLDYESGRTVELDEQMAALVLRGSRSIGPRALYERLLEEKNRHKNLPTYDSLRRDYKEWDFGGIKIGISSTGLALQKEVEKTGFKEDVQLFVKERGVDVLVVMPSFTDEDKNYRRQLILIPSSGSDYLFALSHHLSAPEMGLGLETFVCDKLPLGSLAFWQHNTRGTRKVIQPILQDYYSKT